MSFERTFAQPVGLGENVAAQGAPLGAVLVGGADAAPGGADLAGAEVALASGVERFVGRQDQGRPRRQVDPAVDVHAFVDQGVHLLDQAGGVDDHPRAEVAHRHRRG